MKFVDLPEQCQRCANLKCGHARMDGDNDYKCRMIVLFQVNVNNNCKAFVEESEVD